jgi:thiamine biosynthesis protein ThiI
MEKLILIKYGELTTKKGNRKTFINLLENNIKKSLKDMEYTITKDLSRMFIETNDFNKAIERIKKVFGLHGIIVCQKTDNNIESMANTIIEDLKQQTFKTFKIETRRSDKNFPMESMEVSRTLGAYVLNNINCTVDVHHPDITVNVEIRRDYTYIYTAEIRGIGGYPVGIQGKGLLMLSGGIDSPVAGYLSLKRGVDLECLYFESPPHTSIEAKNKVIKLASILNEYSGNIKVNIVPFTKLQEAIYKNVPSNYNITIMRRMMYRIATKLAYKRKCHVLINGESIGQVASQTLNSMVVINNVTTILITIYCYMYTAHTHTHTCIHTYIHVCS